MKHLNYFLLKEKMIMLVPGQVILAWTNSFCCFFEHASWLWTRHLKSFKTLKKKFSVFLKLKVNKINDYYTPHVS